MSARPEDGWVAALIATQRVHGTVQFGQQLGEFGPILHAQAVKSGLIHFARSRYKRGEVLQAKHSASDAAVTTGTGIVTIAPRAAEACDDSAIF